MTKMVEPAIHNASFKKAARLLLAFTDETPELGVMELSRRVGLNKSTASRFVATLLNLGFLERVEQGSKYRLGTRLFELGMLAVRRRPIVGAAESLLDSLARQNRDTAMLAVAAQGHVMFIQKFDFAQQPSPIVVGQPYPLHCSASGKVILSGLDDAVLAEVLRAPLAKRTERTILSPMRLRDQIAMIRESGYASDHEELELGVANVAAPVYDRNAEVVAAVALSLPCQRVSQASLPSLARGVIDTAMTLSQRLGYRAAITVRFPSDRRGGRGALVSA